MAEITKAHIEAAYKYGKNVNAGDTNVKNAAKNLSQETQMVDSSAQMYVQAVACMLTGKVYKRTINQEATEYYLKSINEEFGEDALKLAISSVEQFIEYSEDSLGSGCPSLKIIIDKYQKEIIKKANTMTLENLNEIGNACKTDYEKNYSWREVSLSESFLGEFSDRFSGKGSSELGKYSGRHTTSAGNTIDYSYTMLEVVTYFVKYIVAGRPYHELAVQIYQPIWEKHKEILSANTPKGNQPDYFFFHTLREGENNWEPALEETYSVQVLEDFRDNLNKIVTDENSKKFLLQALTIKGWSHATKTLNRSDYTGSGCLTLISPVKQKQGFYEDLCNFFADGKNFDLLKKLVIELSSQNKTDRNNTSSQEEKCGDGKNLIVYGAPGSGKSHYIKQLTDEKNIVRTVFHPEYQNSDFVGGLRPYKENGEITYSFVPGPFINALLLATKDQGEHVYLIIEEINRANAAAIFGDIFQLLDRNDHNCSEYIITPEETLKKYLEDEGYPTPSELKIPSNLSILATMNSSDQGVFLLDSAFKRRWGFKYCPIDFAEHSQKASFTNKIVPYKGGTFSWSEFAGVINNTLKRKEIEEDRLIGPYFLTERERENTVTCKQAISGKLLIYLWDDVLRHGLREQLFSSKITTFSGLVNAYNSKKPIFIDKVEDLLDTELEEASASA